ncbi:MAG: transporter [Sphingomonadales bacterium]|nr:transporter [Sphingomonadales bacterium]
MTDATAPTVPIADRLTMPVDVGALIDGRGWSKLQLSVVALCAAAIALDGFDNLTLGFVIPALIKEWGVTKAAFAPLIAATIIVMCIGTAIAGRLGDRLGRRPVLIGSVVLFGTMTLAAALANDIWSLGLARCLAALGMGGAMPNATALLAEFAPARHRNRAVTIGVAFIPVGGFVGGLVAAELLTSHGWRSLFLAGGAFTLVAGIAMAVWLPESPRFLVKDRLRHARLARLLSRIDPTHDGSSRYSTATAAEVEQGGSIFDPSIRFDTFALWAAFFFCLLAVYAMFNWAPTMLSEAGFGLGVASAGLGGFNFGGIFGALLGATAMDKMGSRKPMVLLAIGGAVASIGVAGAVWFHASASAVVGMLVLQGFFICGLQVTLFPLAALIYPATSRATGLGGALAVGRLGAIVSSVAGAALLAQGAPAFMLCVASICVVTALAILVIRGHSQRPTDAL